MEQKVSYFYSIEKELEVYKAMFEALPQSMFLLDKNKIIIGIFNASADTLAGIPINEIVGNSILLYANDPESPFYQACSMLNSTFDPVFKSGVPLKFQYMILDTYLEATISKISGDKILSQVTDITDIILKQKEIELKRHQELSMAMIAGGTTSWSYDVKTQIFSSKQKNNVIDGEVPLKKLLYLIEPEYRDITINMFEDILKNGSKHGHITVLVENLNGVLQWSDIHAIPLEYDEDGNVSLIVGSQKDVTNEYEYNEKLRKLVIQNQLILNNTNSGFVYLNPNLDIEWENLSKIFSDPEIMCLIEDRRLCATECKMHDMCSRNSILKSLETKTQNIVKFRTTSGIVIESIVQPILSDDGDIEGIVLRMDDITERERVVVELAKAKEVAEQSDRLKSAFLANMSHEIRTPLNSIVGFTQLIPDAENIEEQKEYIDIVNHNSEILLNLINDILDLSKIEAGYFNCTNTIFNISELFSELEVMFKYKMNSDVELRCDLPYKEFFVNLDRVRISQIISNFMTNAIKFTKKGYVRMGYQVIENSVKIFVEDTGVGMKPDEASRVFERFEKFNIFVQGTGLGTSIAKAIVDAYDGNVGVESAVGKGSTFWAILPVNISTNDKSKSNMSDIQNNNNTEKQLEASNSTDVKLLVVEDNDSNYMLIKALLRGYKLTRACNGLEAVDMVRNEKYDIVLMDMRMPIMDGIESTKTIREFNTEIPIVAVTANAFDEDRKSALNAGANDFLTKPLNKAKLLETIIKYLNISE